MSADLGNAGAMLCYGLCLARGQGVEEDRVAAARWLKMSADLGDSAGMRNYGANGRGVVQDVVAAARYYKTSADLGYSDGMGN
jgi:TPR repeat protein